MKKDFSKKSQWSKKRKTGDPLEFFSNQFVEKNQNNQRGDSWQYQKMSGKKVSMPKQKLRANILCWLVMLKAFKTMVANCGTLLKYPRLLSSEIGRLGEIPKKVNVPV